MKVKRQHLMIRPSKDDSRAVVLYCSVCDWPGKTIVFADVTTLGHEADKHIFDRKWHERPKPVTENPCGSKSPSGMVCEHEVKHTFPYHIGRDKTGKLREWAVRDL